MKNEREIAELIFDMFRQTKSKVNHVVPIRTIRYGIISKLNPNEQKLFDIVFVGLQALGYYKFERDSFDSIRLSQKGYDYIYDDEKVKFITQRPWIIPELESTDWEKAYNKLWKIIGSKDSQTYICGSDFYYLVYELCDDIPPTYTKYIEFREKMDLSTSRVDFYKELIGNLDESKRFKLYVAIQLTIEKENEKKINKKEEIDLSFIDNQVQTPITPLLVMEDLSKTTLAIPTEEVYKTPRIFISYSWDTPDHERWVLYLASKLRENGVEVTLDKWDLGPLGSPLPNFMESSISKSERVICVMTPNYKKKTDKLVGGVGYEYSIITAEIFSDRVTTSKFIPLLREGDESESIPTTLRGRKYVDMRKDEEFDEKFLQELLRDIFDEPRFKKPALGVKPKFD